jgi:tRNA/tmRNA/rRNA uracil-C5-methylase (TrmA/RlmC/RlmD family)
VRIESLTNLGFGIARVELDDNVEDGVKKKWVIFVPNVIPGELVRVRIYRNFPTYSDADLLEIVEPSADRVEPKCSLATVCGGCQYQHITIELQRKMKTMQVQELFERLGGFEKPEFPAVLDTLGTDEVFGYRSKITPHYDAPVRKGSRKMQNSGETTSGIACEIGPIGFKEKASHRLVDVSFCHIATPAINDALVQIREDKREEARRGLLKKPKKGATLLLRDADGMVETNHTAYVTTTVKDLVFRFQAGNFFQNNPFMLPTMVNLVVDAAKKESSSGNPMTHLIDCYCGSGLFCLGSASTFDVCVGIEVNDVAVAEARENAALNGIQNCAFVSASAEAIFQSQEPAKVNGTEDDGVLVGDFPRESTVVVVDPPRKGCSEEFLEQLNKYQPARVVYMSCDPATQARDAKSLVSFGYEIVSIQPFDLFPQTRHIECLAVFERKS